MLARAALEVLCDDWDMASQYLTYVAAFIEGVEWDEEGDVRGMSTITEIPQMRSRGFPTPVEARA